MKNLSEKRLFQAHVAGLILLFCWISYRLDGFMLKEQGYILGDWLINFQDGGFKRRGLSGSFFFFLQDITGLRLQNLVFGFQMLAYTVFFVAIFRILRLKTLDATQTLLIWSPLNLLCFLHDPKIIGRKETLLFAFFTVYALELTKGNPGRARHMLYFASLSVMTLFHELTLFYLPFLVLLRKMLFQDEKFISFENIGFFVSVLIPVTALVFWGGDINNGRSLEILMDRGVHLPKDNIITFDFDGVQRRIMSGLSSSYLTYPIGFLYGLALLYLAVGSVQKKNFQVGFLACTVYTLPLYYLALDWGRWLHILFMLGMITLIAVLPTRGATVRNNGVINQKRAALYLLIMILNLSMTVMHCCHGVRLNKKIENILSAAMNRL